MMKPPLTFVWTCPKTKPINTYPGKSRFLPQIVIMRQAELPHRAEVYSLDAAESGLLSEILGKYENEKQNKRNPNIFSKH